MSPSAGVHPEIAGITAASAPRADCLRASSVPCRRRISWRSSIIWKGAHIAIRSRSEVGTRLAVRSGRELEQALRRKEPALIRTRGTVRITRWIADKYGMRGKLGPLFIIRKMGDEEVSGG